MRCARSMAWASTAGFHQGSSRNTYSAAVRFSPSPPAFKLIRNNLQSGLSWNRSTCSLRFCVFPSRYSYATWSLSSCWRKIASKLVNCAKWRRGAKHAGIQELEQAPQLSQVILDGRAAQYQPVVRLKKPHRLGRIAARVLDRLRFVQDHIIEPVILKKRDVPAQRSVSG